jgi:hypothetical protein
MVAVIIMQTRAGTLISYSLKRFQVGDGGARASLLIDIVVDAQEGLRAMVYCGDG